MNCLESKFSRIFLATLCFSQTVAAAFATEQHNPINNIKQDGFLFTREFSENSIKQYADFKGINFSEAESTFGYKANCNKLSKIIEVVKKVTDICTGTYSDFDKNCLGTMLFATEIGLPINNFENCSDDDIKKMIYAISCLDNESDITNNATFTEGMSYVKGFLFYNMCLNVLRTADCVSIYQNFHSAKSLLSDLFQRKINNSKNLQQYVNELVSIKNGSSQGNPVDNQQIRKYLNDVLTLDDNDIIIPYDKGRSDIWLSNVIDLFPSRSYNEIARRPGLNGGMPEYYNRKKFGRSLIETELLESRRRIINENKDLPNLLLKTSKENVNYQKISKATKYIEGISDICREREHFFDIYRKKMNVWNKEQKSVEGMAKLNDLEEKLRKKYSKMIDLKVKNWVGNYVKNYFNDDYNRSIKNEFSNFNKSTEYYETLEESFYLLSTLNSSIDINFSRSFVKCKLKTTEIRNSIEGVLKRLTQFCELFKSNKDEFDNVSFKVKDGLKLKGDNFFNEYYLETMKVIDQYIKDFLDFNVKTFS